MKCKKSYTACFLLLLATASIHAKTYAGRVVNDETGIGLAGVSVTLLHSAGKAISDSNGQFSLSGEVGIKSGRTGRTGFNLVKWHEAAHRIDLTLAPQVQSIALFNLKGERLFFKERAAGATGLSMPEMGKNIYIVRMTTYNNGHFIAPWCNSGTAVSFAFDDMARALSKPMSARYTLEFEKQGYQTKQVGVNGDSASMLVDMNPDIGSHVFDDDTIRSYRLVIATADLNVLLDYRKLVPQAWTVHTVYVPARLAFEGRILDSVGVRFRGDQSLTDCVNNGARKNGLKYPQYGFGNGDICAKFGMKFDFNKYKKDQRLFGLKALNFRSMSADPTKMHERLGYSLFADMGIIAPKTGYARLYVNDSLWGVFGIVEQIDGRFTKSRFPNSGDGNLYEDVWPESRTIDDEILSASKTYKDSVAATSMSDFKAFRDMVTATGTDSTNFLEKMKLLVDIPYLVRYMAVDRGITNFDGLVSAYGHMRHNYAWYHDQESGLFKLFPWDLDKTLLYPEPNFWTNNQPRGNTTVPNWNVVNSTYASIGCTFDPGSGGGSYGVEPIDKDKFLRLFRNATWNDFRKQGRVFLDSFFTEKKVNDRIGKWRTRISAAVGEDPTIDSTEWSTMVDSLSHTIPLLRKNLQMMIDTLIVRK
jgi:hypothetical protein